MKVTVRFTLDVPDGTDPQKVLEEAQKSIDSEVGHGGLCRWGEWDVGDAELASDAWIVLIEDRHSDVEARPFSTEEGAVAYGRLMGERSDGATPAQLTPDMRADGWVLYVPYGTEGDSIRVIKRTMDAS